VFFSGVAKGFPREAKMVEFRLTHSKLRKTSIDKNVITKCQISKSRGALAPRLPPDAHTLV